MTTILMDELGVSRTLQRLAHEIIERNHGIDGLVVVGIRNRGDGLARRLVGILKRIEGEVPLGVLDITMYRDDFQRVTESPVIRETDIPFDMANRRVILVDDVLYTGRTIRAALDALMDFGRPASIQLAVLIDRGHRELPIKSDYTGKKVTTESGQDIQVRLKETDGEDSVLLIKP
jgi:pyrimidine operon attenuation protein/uracil phosphoribosyltransferase